MIAETRSGAGRLPPAHPVRVLLATVATIFAAEVVVMMTLTSLPSMPWPERALADAALLSLILVPALYLLVLRPIREHMAARRLAEAEQNNLIAKLQESVSEIRQLRRILPICSSCKKIRDDEGYWHQVEEYFRARALAEFSHGYCPDCLDELKSQIKTLGTKN